MMPIVVATGRLNDRYQLVRRLGRGGEAEVFLALDRLRDDAPRALKVVSSGATDPDGTRRLAAEFRRLASLDHPSLPRVYDLEIAGPGSFLPEGTLFFTADYIDGRPPEEALADVPEEDRGQALVRLGADVASALAHIHAAGLLHHDVKPSNLVVTTARRTQLLDLGLSTARRLGGAPRGTPAYMAPERFVGVEDPRSDLYALGVTLYELATGRRPFEGDDPASLVRVILEAEVVPPRRRAPWLPEPLEEVVLKLLSRAPEDRHSSAVVLLEDFARVAEACGYAGPLSDERRPVRGRGRRRASTPATTDEVAALAPLPPPLCGREEAMRELEDYLEALVAGRAAERVLRIAGAPGAGKTRLLEEAVRRRQLRVAAGRAAPLTLVGDTWERLARALALGENDPSAEGTAAGRAGWVPGDRAPVSPEEAERHLAMRAEEAAASLDALAARAPVLVHFGSDDDPRVRALVALAGSMPGEGRWAIAVECADEPPPLEGARTLVLPPLGTVEVERIATAMLGRPPSCSWISALRLATGGLPRLIVEAIREAALRAGTRGADAVSVDEIVGAGDLSLLVRRRLETLPPRSRAVVEAVAVIGGAATAEEVGVILGLDADEAERELARLSARGWLVRAGDSAALPSRAHTEAVVAGLSEARRRALHSGALAVARGARARARHLAVVGSHEEAIAAAFEAAALARIDGDLNGALSHLDAVAARARGERRRRLEKERAELCVVLGRYDEAIAAARRAGAGAEGVLARALQRSGDLDGAEEVLRGLFRGLVGSGGTVGGAADEARGALARLLVARGRYAEASEVAGRPEDEPPAPLSPGRSARLEAAGLAALYGGDGARAELLFGILAEAARAAGDRVLESRALSLLGQVAQGRGDVARAAALYGEALAHARAAGDLHGAFVYALNRSSALAEQGLFGEVLAVTTEAIRALRRLGRVGEIAGALYNRGVALLSLGDVAAARRAAEQALGEARARGLPQLEVWATLLCGDVSRRAGDAAGGLEAYERAQALADSIGVGRAQAAMNRAEALAELGRMAEAARAVAEAQNYAAHDDERDRVALTRTRVALAKGDDPREARAALLAAAGRLRASGRRDLAWRADALLARLAARTGDLVAARAAAERARAGFRAIVDSAPEARRDGMLADPDARELARLEAALGPDASSEVAEGPAPYASAGPAPYASAGPAPYASGGPASLASTAPPYASAGPAQPYASAGPAPLASAAPLASVAVGGSAPRDEIQRLRRLVRLAKRMNSELRLERLLDDVIDTVIELCEAERGFLLLFGPDGRLEIQVARNIDQRALEGEELAVSRSIAERAVRSGEPVLTVDAAGDETWGGVASVTALKLRSVLAVPLRVQGEVVGCVYVDHRFRRGAFREEDVALLIDLADLAAIALRNARLVEENRRLLERQSAELDGARAVLRQTTALEIRYAYDALIGRSPRMLELLRILDRATDTSLPVVIYGESGTGKELVARALHQNGPRRDRPFVPVNCAAVPEPLLEAELFGHVRGAFTGADRDRRGLFEIADGGTLFLDEIADTSPAMQTKLLRVLQEGEIRRVGGERPRKVDVRVIGASNRDLRRLVDEGRFREDLFYRLHVVRIDVPPLRERSEDIPALVEHFLRKLAGQGRPPKRIDRAAMARLLAYSWPGNVRELENELARAVALGGDVITVADLSPAVAAADPGAPPAAPDDLDLRRRVETLERSLLREALGRTRGNQTAAARLLGLSRFGLQKKLRRYGL